MAIGIAFLLGFISLGELVVIWALLNRLLIQAKVEPLVLPFPNDWTDDEELPKRETRRKLFSTSVEV